jgi:hypothetical protein
MFPHLYPLMALKKFYEPGRNVHGGYMGENEDAENATYRNLSTFEDTELEVLIKGAERFILACRETLSEREIDG